MSIGSTVSTNPSGSRFSLRAILDVLGCALEANRVLGGSSILAPKAIRSLRVMAERV